MYTPKAFRVEDQKKFSAFMDATSFATFITCSNGIPTATHLPMRHHCSDNVCTKLYSHLARANSQWQDFNSEKEALTVFTGPHAYISPSWYAAKEAVPTWNYTAIHVYGYPRIISDRHQVIELLKDMVEFYESSFQEPWQNILSDEYRNKMIDAIVAFEVEVTRIEAKFKLGQNRDATDRQGIYQALSSSPNHKDRQLAELMKSEHLVQSNNETLEVPLGRNNASTQ